MDRKRFVWDVQLQRNDGEVGPVEFASYWSPEKVDPDLVAKSAAAIATVFSQQEVAYVGLTATLRA